jgi:hypothetical protein
MSNLDMSAITAAFTAAKRRRKFVLSQEEAMIMHIASLGGDELDLMSRLRADPAGPGLLARDFRAPGRQLDRLESLGLVVFDGDEMRLGRLAREVTITVE